jgi:tetrapyrrole methylase family protein/MazG family protein
VPGHPLVGEESVRLIIERARAAGIPWQLLPAASFLDAAAAALAAAGQLADFSQLQVVDGARLGEGAEAAVNGDLGVWWNLSLPALVYQVDDAAAASQAKLALMEVYPDDHPVQIIRHAGIAQEETVTGVPLYEMDRPAAGEYDHLTCFYLAPLPPSSRRPGFAELVAVVARLRAPGGCPWDREQNYETLKRFVLEEAYEVLEAVDAGDSAQLCDEIGDLMLQVLMYAQFAAEDGFFDIRDVIANTVDKLVRRHPHVFGDVTAETADEVLRNWERIKGQERPQRESVLDGVPRHLPALMRAMEVSKRAVRVGFEWPALEDVFAKLAEEIDELREAIAAGEAARQRDELGDLLFTLVNIARWLKIDPEEALRAMVQRFTARFREVERLAAASGRSLTGMSIDDLDALWESAKQTEQ